MAEPVTLGYSRLFEIRLLHHYWLDEGATLFDQMPDAARRDKRLQSYDARSFLTIAPTDATARRLAGLRAVFKDTALGCVVGVPGDAVISPAVVLDFVVTVRSPDFSNYTALTLRPRKIQELYYLPEDRMYRFKGNVPVLSNLTGDSRGTGQAKSLFLSRPIPGPAADDGAEALVISNGALQQLTGDQPGAGAQELCADAAKWPVFVHQGDVPAIVPPAGLAGAPARGIPLTADIPDAVFALIRISAAQAVDADFSCVDAGGRAKTPAPVYQVRFKNRSTRWRYIDKDTHVQTSITPYPLPLTYFGLAGAMPKPPVGSVRPETAGGRITQIVSDLFI